MLNTKEQVLYYFLYHDIRLNVYDKKFLTNLENLIKNTKRVTSNQKKLFEKIILKYKKQFFKKGFDVIELSSLPWQTTIIDSDARYTTAQVSIIDNNLTLRTPFNRNFITEFKQLPDNTFVWSKENKFYTSNISVHSLKILYNILPKFYTSINYDQQSQKIIDDLNLYSAKYWEPTLVKVNKIYLIAGINEFLYEATKDIILNDKPKTLFQLSQFGIKIDESILGNNFKKRFASDPRPNIDIKHFSKCVKWLSEFDINLVYSSKGMAGGGFSKLVDLLDEKLNLTANIFDEVEKVLDRNKIKYVKNGKYFYDNNFIGNTVIINPVRNKKYTYFNKNKRVCKYITVLNSQEIDVK